MSDFKRDPDNCYFPVPVNADGIVHPVAYSLTKGFRCISNAILEVYGVENALGNRQKFCGDDWSDTNLIQSLQEQWNENAENFNSSQYQEACEKYGQQPTYKMISTIQSAHYRNRQRHADTLILMEKGLLSSKERDAIRGVLHFYAGEDGTSYRQWDKASPVGCYFTMNYDHKDYKGLYLLEDVNGIDIRHGNNFSDFYPAGTAIIATPEQESPGHTGLTILLPDDFAKYHKQCIGLPIDKDAIARPVVKTLNL